MKPMKFSRFRLYTLGSRRPDGFAGEIREVWEAEAEERFAIISTSGEGTAHLLMLAREAAGRFTPAGAPRMFASIHAARTAAAMAWQSLQGEA